MTAAVEADSCGLWGCGDVSSWESGSLDCATPVSTGLPWPVRFVCELSATACPSSLKLPTGGCPHVGGGFQGLCSTPMVFPL